MKQRITISQLHELSEEKRERLREWWKPQVGDWYEHCHDQSIVHNNDPDFIEDYWFPLLSIGQMIQFLTTHIPTSEEYQLIMWKNPKFFPTYNNWNVEYFQDTNREKHKEHGREELCDSLWEAVKSFI